MNVSNFFKVIFLMLIVVFIGYKVLCNFNIIENTINVEDINSIDAPIQSFVTGSTVVKSYGVDVNLTYVAKYEIAGRVVATHDYLETSVKDYLAPVDVGLSWGKLAKDEYHKKVSYSLTNRYLRWFSDDSEFISKIGGTSGVSKLNSNNHLIPSNSEIKRLIKSIRTGDFIKIKGYLVNANYETSNSKFVWQSSKTRLDTGNGACELIYVTSVEWLKQK